MNGYLVGAFFFLLATIFYALPLFAPNLRNGWRWGEGHNDGPPVSLFGHASWAFAFLACTVALAAEGFHYAPITTNTGKILFTAFGFVALANLIDNIINRKK
jgi:hypothetical protein